MLAYHRAILHVLAPGLLVCAGAHSQSLPASGVVFDDFDYDNAVWVDDEGANASLNAGSLFGWNLWARDLNGLEARYRDRLWYRGYSWAEPYVNDEFYRTTELLEFEDFENGGLVIRAPEGYCGPRDATDQPACAFGNVAQAEINSGFVARRGAWAARINFSNVDDVLGLLQSFWTMSPYVAVVPSGESMTKAWSEMDHEFNNNFNNNIGRGVFDATGYIEGTSGRNDRIMRSNLETEYELGSERGDYSCTFVVEGNGSENDFARTLPPATCASLFVGEGPQLVYGYPALSAESNISVDILISNETNASSFSARASWWGPSQTGDASDPHRHYFSMGTNSGNAGGTSQVMSGRFSQYVANNLGATPPGYPFFELNFGNNTLQQDHDMAIDWFFFSPDPSLDLDKISDLVDLIRDSESCNSAAEHYGCRLNTLLDSRMLHRPYSGSPTTNGLTPLDPAAVYLEAPARAMPGQSAELVGFYAHRMGDLRLVWEYNLTPLSGRVPGNWITLSQDAWFRQDASFPASGVTTCSEAPPTDTPPDRSSAAPPSSFCGINFRLRVGEYGPNAYATGWPTTGMTYTSSPVISYVYDGSSYVCSNCSAALPHVPAR